MITTTVTPEYTGVLFLGRRGEENARQFIFDVKDWVSDFSIPSDDGYEIRMLVKRPRERTAYPATLLHEGSFAWVWKPQPADFAKTGEGEIELQFVMAEDTVMKSAVIRTKSEGCIGDSEGPVPEDQPGWFRQVLDSTNAVLENVESVQANADRAEDAAKRAEQAAENADGGVFVAEYNKTTFEEVKKAWDEGKTIVCRSESGNYTQEAVLAEVYLYPSYQYFRFFRMTASYYVETYTVSSYVSGSWSRSTYALAPRYHTHFPEDCGAMPSYKRALAEYESMDDYNIPGIFTVSKAAAPTVDNAPFERSYAFQFTPGNSANTLGKQEAWVHSQSNPEYAKRVKGATGWSAWKYD